MTVIEQVCAYCDGLSCACPPGTPRIVRPELDGLTADGLRASLRGRDLWRYERLLPVSRDFGSRLAVGGTPLLDLGEVSGGIRLHVKDDTRNPSGSLKDRATEVALAVARSQGHDRVIAASTGNAGASLACIAAAQGMHAMVVVPESAPVNKLNQILAYGAELVTVPGSYDDAFDHALDYARRNDVFCRNTGVNPYVREGKKTCALEIAEQLGWRSPTWVIVPTGDGNIINGIGTGFRQLTELGCLDRMPRLVAAQAASSDSITRTYAEARAAGTIPRVPLPAAPDTAADSIAVSRPRDHIGAVRVLLGSDGLAVTSSEQEIREAAGTLARGHGLWVEPSAATGYAVFARLRDTGVITEGDTVVLLATGTGLKDPRPWDD
ncbi:MAG TPA: threonine synthase [Actinoplanes sp.]|nr:threonine synthase [Actinoplanes sp.]